MKNSIILLISILLFSCQNKENKLKTNEIKIENELRLDDSLTNLNSAKKEIILQKNNVENSTHKDKEKIPSKYLTYCNARFQFCIHYPYNFIPQGESDNGDGQSFLSKNGEARITSSGVLLIDEINDIETSFNSALERGNIIYKKKKDNYFVVSGIIGDNIFYQKSHYKKIEYFATKGGTADVVITYVIEYPIKKKEIYNTYCSKIDNDLK